ncbi:MAG: AI-2E family transporter [Acidobacteriota bacterium]
MNGQEDSQTPAELTPAELREQLPHARRIFLDPSSPPMRSIIRVVITALLLLLVVGLVGFALYSLTYLLFLVVLAIFFAYLIDPLVRLIRRPFKLRKMERFMPRSLAIVISYLIVFLVLGSGIAGIAPKAVEQGKEFGGNIPAYGTSVRASLNELQTRFNRLRVPEDLQSKVTDQATSLLENVTAAIGNTLIALVGYLPWFILVPILAFFFLKDINSFRLSVLRIFPAGPLRIRADAILKDINTTLAAYTRAQLISCFLVGLICTIGFYIIGIKYALLFGILAGIFEFVPLIGPITIGIVVTSLAAFSDNPWKALYVGVFLIILRILQDYVLYPKIVRGGIHLHPIAVILSVLAGEQLAGIPGVFLAIPVVAILSVFYKHAVEHSGHKGLFSAWLEPDEETPVIEETT